MTATQTVNHSYAGKVRTKKVSPGHYEYKEWYIVKDDENEDTRGEAGFLWYANHPDLGEYWARTKSDILEIIKQVEDRQQWNGTQTAHATH